MNAKLLFRLLMTNTGRKILLYTTIGVLSLFFFMILILCTFLSMPKEWLNNFLSQYLGDQHIEIIYQIRPDLLDPEPEEAPNNNKDYEFVLPIKRTVRHYFGEKGSFNGVNIDYIVFDCNGDNLYSIGDGVVKEVDNTTVTIEYEASDNDPNNWFIYAKYFPMSEVNVTLGEEVEKGQVIGKADIADDVSKLRIFCFGMWGDSDPEWVDPITLGDTTKVTPIFTPAQATNKKVTWSSNREDRAIVDKNGVVTGRSPGAVIIKCVSDDGGLSAACMIVVTE